ncbi:Conserved_hypothetical protein [Hexamita inflata]|uniref:Uncharacterized protein n=1 Tax=Hexamita inflata TaxID=28002 RepID=A0AA86U2B4_9EUKA|nr:Conserved hypothetical protein [Hexamita inflata]
MSRCGLKNIEQIASLVNLKELDLSQNMFIQDIAPLYKLNGLTKLQIRQCKLNDIDQISLLVNLEELDLSENLSIDISPLCKLKNLTKLSMNNCYLKNIDQIVQLTNIEVLNIRTIFSQQIQKNRKPEPLTQRNPKPTQITQNGVQQLQTRNKRGVEQRASKSDPVHSERGSSLPAVESIWARMMSGNYFVVNNLTYTFTVVNNSCKQHNQILKYN